MPENSKVTVFQINDTIYTVEIEGEIVWDRSKGGHQVDPPRVGFNEKGEFLILPEGGGSEALQKQEE